MSQLNIIIAGCGGAMGIAVLRSALESGVTIEGGFDRSGSPVIGKDLGTLGGAEPLGVVAGELASAQISQGSVVVDFTTPKASVEIAKIAVRAGASMVIGSTGFDADQEEAVRQASEKTAIVKSGNMSLGVNLLCALVERAAASLPEAYDIEIVEAHHRRKVDAPSGTALMLGDAAAKGRDVSLKNNSVRTRDGITEPRKAGDIGFAIIRGGGVVGDHEVRFAGDKEILTLSHHAIDRALFAEGALAAAKWVAGKPPGLYTMRDVLGLS